MKAINSLCLGASILALGLGAMAGSSDALAGSTATSEHVQSVELDIGINAFIVEVENTSANKQVDAVNLSPVGTHLNGKVGGELWCAKEKGLSVGITKAYFGPLVLGGNGAINANATLYGAPHALATHTWLGLLEGWISEYIGGPAVFSIPLNEIKNGPALLRLDPVAEIEKKLQAHLQGGGTALDFFQNPQDVYVNRPISVAGSCWKNGWPKAGYRTQNVNILVRYVGDPQVNDNPVLSAQLGGQQPNQFQEVAQPLEITEVNFQPNLPPYVGQCPPAQDPKIPVIYKGTGEGFLRLRVKEGAVEVHRSNAIAYDSDNGAAFYDFAYPLKDRLQHAAFKNWATLNQTFNHHLNLEVQTRDVTPKVQANYASGDGWSEWKKVDQATWRHRCTPKLGVPAAGGIGGYQQNGGANAGAGGRALAKPAATAPARPARQEVAPEPVQPTTIRRATTRPPRAD